jgi:predicted RecB family endonuclease
LKSCPECGSDLPVGTANFCPTCGKKLWEKESDSLKSFANENQSQRSDRPIYAQGVKLEDMVEEILRNKGFSTLKREKLQGKSTAIHEIDVLAKKDNKTLGVECKNYGETRTIGIKEIRDFHSKLKDLPDINHALFVTNVAFTTSVEEYANHYDIELWDGDKLRNDFYLLHLGRLDPSLEEIVVGPVLPLVTDYEEAIKLSVVNPEASRVSEVMLILHPYFLFEYKADIIKKGILTKQTIHDSGKVVFDANRRKIVRGKDVIMDTSVYAILFFSKNEKFSPEQVDEQLNKIEEAKVYRDLTTLKPESQYRLEKTGEYAINKLDCKITKNVAERMVLEKVVQDKGANHSDVKFNKSLLVYVPKWLILFESKTTAYKREILSASQQIIFDDIALCPKELLGRIRSAQKRTYAICEVCGRAYCKNHMLAVAEAYYCEKHNFRSNIPTINANTNGTETEGKFESKDPQTSLEKVKDSLDSAIDRSLNKVVASNPDQEII